VIRTPRRIADSIVGMTRRLVQDERGMALVLALFAMSVLSITAAALLTTVAVNHRSSLDSANAKRAFGYAELGVAYAEGKVYSAASTHVSPTAGVTTLTMSDGTVQYSTSVAGDGVTWTMTGTGIVGGISRTVTASANVPSAHTVTDAGVWNYLYADKVTNDGTCPTTIGGSTVVSVPTFTRGNLCLQSAFTGAQLEVGGNLTVSGGKGAIGTSSQKVPILAVAGTCNGVTAGTGACNGATSPIYATTAKSTLDVNPGLPAVNINSYYSSSNPGPTHACGTGSFGVPTPFFDNDTTLNNSLTTVNLFPATAYDCKSGANEISWTPSSNSLHVVGTFVFDGSLSVSGNSHVLYTGSGTIYFTGTITTAGNWQLCGILNCTTSWNPDTNGLILVAACWANSTGSTLVTFATTGNYCVKYGGGNVVQVGTYCATDYYISGTATNMGPVLSNTLTLNGNMSALIPFHVMPPGTPMNTSTVYLPATAPNSWSG
jgi:Tfp pilus assembly protein PilX